MLHRAAIVIVLTFRFGASGASAAVEAARGIRAEARPMSVQERSLAGLALEGSAGLFVGVGRFDTNSGLSDLRFTPDDAVALAHLFVSELELLPPANTVIALGGEPRSQRGRLLLAKLRAAGAKVMGARRTELWDALSEVADKASDEKGLVVMAFSSHGFEEKGTAYIMPEDGRRRFVSSTGFSVQSVKDTLRDAKAAKKLLFLDACRETLGSDTRGEAKMAGSLREALSTAQGFGVLASCSVGQLSWESPELEQGVFTHFILEAARGGARSPVNDGFIRLGEISTYAARATRDWVARNKKEVQEPWFEGEIARSIPLAFDARVAQQQEAQRAALAALAQRRARALDVLTEARKSNRDLLTGRLEDDIAAALQSENGASLGELLEQVEDLADPKPARVRSFLAWWKGRSSSPAAAVRSTNILEGLRLGNASGSTTIAVPRPTNSALSQFSVRPLTNMTVAMLLRGLDSHFCDKLHQLLGARESGFENFIGEPVTEASDKINPTIGAFRIAPTWTEWKGRIEFLHAQKVAVMEGSESRTYKVQFPADGPNTVPTLEDLLGGVRDCLGKAYIEKREPARGVMPFTVTYSPLLGSSPVVTVRSYKDAVVLSVSGAKAR